LYNSQIRNTHLSVKLILNLIQNLGSTHNFIMTKELAKIALKKYINIFIFTYNGFDANKEHSNTITCKVRVINDNDTAF